MPPIEQLTLLILASGASASALAVLLLVLRDVYRRQQETNEHIARLYDLYLRSSTKVPPEDNS